MQRTLARDPGAGVGDPEQLEQRLDGPVLAARSVQGDEGDVGALLLEPADEALVGVDRDDLVAECRDRLLDPRARLQGDGPLERAPALEDSDLHPGSVPERFPGNGRTSPDGGSGPAPSAPGSEAERSERVVVLLGSHDLEAAGHRLVEVDLLVDDGADPADPLADLVLGLGREVEPHRAAAAAVDEGRLAGDEGDVLAQRLREQVGRVDVVGQRRPDEQPALRLRPARLPRGSRSASASSIASRRER